MGSEPHALASGPVLTRVVLCQPPEFPLSRFFFANFASLRLKFWFWLVQIRSQRQGKITEVLRTQESEEGRERRPAGEKPRNETADQNDS